MRAGERARSIYFVSMSTCHLHWLPANVLIIDYNFVAYF